MKYAGEYHEASHERFIPKELFEKVQEIAERKNKPRFKDKKFPFMGLATCRECGCSITADEHYKVYPKTRGKVRYVYYRCTKKKQACSQKYISDTDFEKQLREIISKVALSESWANDWYKWMEEDEIAERQNIEANITKLKLQTQALDEKLNKLLDGYLDGVIESEIYKAKQNEIFEEKLRIQENISKIEDYGSSWLEPMREFVKSVLLYAKVARAKNSGQDLVNLAKAVGSNYFLEDRRILVNFKKGYNTLYSEFYPHANSDSLSENSMSVDPEGVEPSTRNYKFPVLPLNYGSRV